MKWYFIVGIGFLIGYVISLVYQLWNAKRTPSDKIKSAMRNADKCAERKRAKDRVLTWSFDMPWYLILYKKIREFFQSVFDRISGAYEWFESGVWNTAIAMLELYIYYIRILLAKMGIRI